METKEQITGLNRNTIDKFYTKDSVVDFCLEVVKQYVDIKKSELILEPSAGNGAFISGIKKLVNNYIFYDINPEHDEIINQDYFSCDYKKIKKQYKTIHIIGNPPFGRQSSLAVRFIRHSCKFAKTISFILPRSFKKESLKSKVPLNFHLLFEIDLPEKSFLVNGLEYDVPCVFQIWEKQNVDRKPVEKIEPQGFIFVKKTEKPDISFRRVGVNAGLIDTDIQSKSIQSHYFIKFTNDKSLAENKLKVSNITYDSNNTVGPKSISKQELTHKFNIKLNSD